MNYLAGLKCIATSMRVSAGVLLLKSSPAVGAPSANTVLWLWKKNYTYHYPASLAELFAGNLMIIYTLSFIIVIITVGVAKWFPRRS